jgi:hypothetical protein
MNEFEHVDYPHHPGYLYGCPACEARCHCEAGDAPCVWEGHIPCCAGMDDGSSHSPGCPEAEPDDSETEWANGNPYNAKYPE